MTNRYVKSDFAYCQLLKNYSLRQLCMYAIAYIQNYMLDVCNFAFSVHVSLLSLFSVF